MIDQHTIDIEKACLGSIFLSEDTFADVIVDLKPTFFFDKKNQAVFRAMMDLYLNNESINYISVANRIRLNKDSRTVKDDYLVELQQADGVTRDSLVLSKMVYEQHLKRRLKTTLDNLNSKIEDGETDPLDLVSELEDLSFELSMSINKKDVVHIQSLTDSVMSTIEYAFENKRADPAKFIPTGYKALDAKLIGWKKGEMVIVAARPSMGKTALGLQFARNVARKGRNVAIFSLEMGEEALTLRLVGLESGVNTQRAERGKISQKELDRIKKARNKVAEYSIYIDDTAAITPVEIKSKLRQLVLKYNIEMVIVDYMQLMTASRKDKSTNREQEVASISRELKACGKEMNLATIILAQISRDNTKQADKRPQLHNIRESGAVEQDADVVIFIHRPEYYGAKELMDGSPSEGVAEIIIAKQRNGPTGTVLMSYDRTTGRFSSYKKKKIDLGQGSEGFGVVNEDEYKRVIEKPTKSQVKLPRKPMYKKKS